MKYIHVFSEKIVWCPWFKQTYFSIVMVNSEKMFVVGQLIQIVIFLSCKLTRHRNFLHCDVSVIKITLSLLLLTFFND